MVSCVSIVNALQSPDIEICGLGHVRVYPNTIEVGNNCVAARCHVDGTEGDMIIKCYYRNTPAEELVEYISYHVNALKIVSLDGVTEYVDVAFMRWVEGDALDVILYRGECDYAQLSRAFDRMALDHKRRGVVHGDVKPENIIVTPEGEMQLVDFDLSPRGNVWGYRAVEYGTSFYIHRNRRIRRTDEYTDDYPLALISILLAAMAIDTQYFNECSTMEQNIAVAEKLLHEAGDMTHYNIALAMHTSIMGKIDELEAMLECCVKG